MYRVVKVRIRNTKEIEEGDKLASRHAQKSTVSIIRKVWMMPFTSNGDRPDLIINPHAIPTRMTIGKLAEVVMSKVAALRGERFNSTAFNFFDMDRIGDVQRMLVEYGFKASGYEVMTDGVTGQKMNATIFIGPVYYQRLRHVVASKIQARDTGPINPLTRAPVKGRKRTGGLRFGEMERDALMSHGTSKAARGKMCRSANPFESAFCTDCGRIAITDVGAGEFMCRICPESNFNKSIIPYSTKLVINYLKAAGINLRLNFTDKINTGSRFRYDERLEDNEENTQLLDDDALGMYDDTDFGDDFGDDFEDDFGDDDDYY